MFSGILRDPWGCLGILKDSIGLCGTPEVFIIEQLWNFYGFLAIGGFSKPILKDSQRF